MRSSFITFGGNREDSDLYNKASKLRVSSTPGGTMQYSLNKKTKMSDLNKQNKNFNMPIALNCRKQKLIDQEGIAKAKNILEQVNNT